ncbi:DUF4184 family protein [Marinobacter zhejiangensis]|uniref:LexA-binding, inner membrane-associated hydrolase n=1 Tax=Marinobacter zhejiangensis TaxID=488535 RepID=A0A1I4T3K9_9GAMM|nr:protein of unknown function [Marinobacter zhejiangensis]
MPFTPFHLGPGAVVKAVLPKHFSLSAFALTQVFIDLESLYNLVYGKWPVHAFFHTYVGATLAAVLAMLVVRLLFSRLLQAWNSLHKRSEDSRLHLGNGISWLSALVGSLLGAYSHVFLDSIMHPDIRPLAPLNSANVLHHIISVPMLHLICLFSALVGFVWLLHLLFIGRYKA